MATAQTPNDARRRTRTSPEDDAQCHRHIQSRMELSKSDMLQLLGHLEAELQARDAVIAILKSEKAKQFLYQAKYGRFSLSDPLYAMQRESDSKGTPAARPKFDDPMTQLDKLIEKQHEAEKQMREQLDVIDVRHQKVCAELEEESWRHNHDLEQGDSVVFMLEKDRERLQHEVQAERSQSKNLEAEVQLASDELEKFAKHREVVMKLLKKRSQIVKEVTDTRCDIASLEDALSQAESEAKRIEDCVASECSKHLHIESVAEQQFGVAAREREQLLSRLSLVESHNRQLNTELDKLRSSVGPRHRHNPPVAYNNNNVQGVHGAPASRNVASSNEVVAVMNDRVVLQAKQHGAVPSDSYVRGSSVVGDVRYLPDRVQHFSSGMTVSTKSCGQVSESSGASKHTGGHRTAQTRAGDVQTVPAYNSVNPSLTPTMVSVMTNSGSRISVAVSGASSQIYRQVSSAGAAAASAGRSVPPPIPPNKPQVLITQPQLPASHAGGGAPIRAIPVAQPPSRPPQTQVRYGITFNQGRTALPDKPTLTAAVATGSRQAPVLVASQSGTSSHLAMVVGEATTVHKRPSQVCVDIK